MKRKHDSGIIKNAHKMPIFESGLFLYRFHEHWRFVLQRLVFLAAFVVYLETETLVTREAVTEILGSKLIRRLGGRLDMALEISCLLIAKIVCLIIFEFMYIPFPFS